MATKIWGKGHIAILFTETIRYIDIAKIDERYNDTIFFAKIGNYISFSTIRYIDRRGLYLIRFFKKIESLRPKFKAQA